MWYYIWVNDLDDKDKYLQHEFKDYTAGTWLSDCACCEYYLRLKEDDCPLKAKNLCAFNGSRSAYRAFEECQKTKESAKKLCKALIKFWIKKGFEDKKIDKIIKGRK